MEEIRAKYYREMKKFVCLPQHFRGVGESATAATTIFPRMIDRNATSFSTVYKKVKLATPKYTCSCAIRASQFQVNSHVRWIVIGLVCRQQNMCV